MRKITVFVMDDQGVVLDEIDIEVEASSGKDLPIGTRIIDFVKSEFDLSDEPMETIA